MILRKIKAFFEDGKEMDEVYRQRNYAVLMALKALDESERKVGWKEADDTNSEWIVVWTKLPQVYGEEKQVAWHMKREILSSFDFLEKKYIEYDGHSDEEKKARIEKYLMSQG